MIYYLYVPPDLEELLYMNVKGSVSQSLGWELVVLLFLCSP